MDATRIEAVEVVHSYMSGGDDEGEIQKVEVWLRTRSMDILQSGQESCEDLSLWRVSSVLLSVILSMIDDIGDPVAVSPLLKLIWNLHQHHTNKSIRGGTYVLQTSDSSVIEGSSCSDSKVCSLALFCPLLSWLLIIEACSNILMLSRHNS